MAAPLSFECRWAFLGLSSIAELFFRDLNLPREEGDPIRHRLVAISTTRSIERATQWLTEQGVPNPSTIRLYTSYEEMLQGGEFDVVYISTPHGVHFRHASAAIQNERHVLVEKPAVMNKAQYERLAVLARERHTILMEAMWTRYLPLTQYLETELLPRLGHIKRVLADYSLPLFADPTMEPNSRFLDKNAGSGSLMDLGVYPLTWCDIALPRDTRPVSVKYAETIEHETGTGEPIDDLTTVILSGGEDPVTCVVTISSSLPGSATLGLREKLLRVKNAPCVRIQGTEAEVALPFPPIRPETLTIQYYGNDKVDSKGFEKEETITKEVVGWGLWYQADVIAKAIRDHDSTKNSGIVVNYEGTSRVFEWVDQAKKLAGITYDKELEEVY